MVVASDTGSRFGNQEQATTCRVYREYALAGGGGGISSRAGRRAVTQGGRTYRSRAFKSRPSRLLRRACPHVRSGLV